jgi:hypothetical protein
MARDWIKAGLVARVPEPSFKTWVNGSLILQRDNVQTGAGSHQDVELCIKLYGDSNGQGP